MKKLLSHRRIWLSVGIVSAITGALSVVLVVLFAIKFKFVLMGISIAFLAHAFYGCPFYFIAYANTKVYGRIVDAVENQKIKELSVIADYAMMKEDFIEGQVKKTIAKGYLLGYMISDGRVLKPSEISDEKIEEENGKCEFCGSKLSYNEKNCSSCGAPNKMTKEN